MESVELVEDTRTASAVDDTEAVVACVTVASRLVPAVEAEAAVLELDPVAPIAKH